MNCISVKPTILLILCCCYISSCSSPDSSTPAVPIDTYRVYPIDTESKQVSFFDVIEEVEVIRLEETDQSLIGYIPPPTLTGNKIIFNSGIDPVIYVFSKKGDFIAQIDRFGQGPEQYEVILDHWFEDSLIAIYDPSVQKLKKYDFSGNLISEKKSTHRFISIRPYQQGYIGDMSFAMDTVQSEHSLIFFDENFKEEHRSIPFINTSSFFNTGGHAFQHYGEHMLFTRYLSDSVFLIEDKQERVLMKFDFGDNWLWDKKSIAEHRDVRAMMEMKKQMGLPWAVTPLINNDLVYLSVSSGMAESSNFLIDRKTGNYIPLHFRRKGLGRYYMGAKFWSGDRLLFGLNAEDARDFMNELGEGRWKLRENTILEEIENHENPALMWVKFKNFE